MKLQHENIENASRIEKAGLEKIEVASRTHQFSISTLLQQKLLNGSIQ
jgi:hypothetical protein